MTDLPRPQPRSRIAAEERPSIDEACAGCPQLVTFRALRRAGLAVQGGLPCDPGRAGAFVPAAGRWAAVLGGEHLVAHGAGALLASARRAGAALVVVADDLPERTWFLEELLATAEASVQRLEVGDVVAAEARVLAAAEHGAVLLAVAPCTRGGPRAPPLSVTAARCNRCGACLSLGCPALSDPGGEAMWVDPRVCSGCGRCAPLCRGHALSGTPR